MIVELLGFEGCPNWPLAEQRLAEAGRQLGLVDLVIERREVTSPSDAEAFRFTGSPTIRVDGVDPFETGAEAVGMACRVYSTPEGLAGCPTVGQLMAALNERAPELRVTAAT